MRHAAQSTLAIVVLNLISTGDLFPGQNPPRKVDEELEHFVVKACEVTGNHPDDLFCLKVLDGFGRRRCCPKAQQITLQVDM